MPASWPVTLPQDVLVQGYAEAFPSTTLRTQMDAGPAKTRRRFTASVRPLRVTMPLTRAQVALLDTFYTDTLEGGALEFTWTHPRTLAAVTLRFVSPPQPVPDSGAWWRVDLDLEVLP